MSRSRSGRIFRLRLLQSATNGGAGVGDEGAEFLGVFAAGGCFDAGDDVEAPGMERGDGLGYVFRGEAAGGDQLTLFYFLEESIGSEGPVEGLAGAAGGGCGARVDEDGVDVGVLDDGGDLPGGIGVEMNYAEDAQRGAEMLTELGGEIGRGFEVKLDAGERAGLDGGGNLGEGRVDEDADFFERGRQVGNDGGGLGERYAAGAGSEDETNGIGPSFGG